MRLPEGYPAQLVDGQLLKDPSPVPWHQALVLDVYEAARRVVPKPRVLVAPVDVFIDEHNVLQPDVLILPEDHSVRSTDLEVPLPVLVVEVLSPSTARRDRHLKSRIYLEAGIREVWVVDPVQRTIEVRTPGAVKRAGTGDKAASEVVVGFEMDVDDLFSS